MLLIITVYILIKQKFQQTNQVNSEPAGISVMPKRSSQKEADIDKEIKELLEYGSTENKVIL